MSLALPSSAPCCRRYSYGPATTRRASRKAFGLLASVERWRWCFRFQRRQPALRNYADTTGGGNRDTWGIAISNLGSASSNSIDNSGVIRLAGATVGRLLPVAKDLIAPGCVKT
ncbi:hypothetical protein D3C81_1707830 [compost metagenome]